MKSILLLLGFSVFVAIPARAQDDAQALLDRAYEESDSHRTEAIADFTKALALDPHNVLAFCERGYVYSALGKYPEAVADYDRAVQLAPEFTLAWVNRGINNGLAGRPDKELEDESHAIALDPRNSEAYAARGMAYFRHGDYARAIADFDQAIEPDADSESADNPTSGFRDSAGNFQAAIGVNEGGNHLYYNRGAAYLKLGQPDRALADLNKSILDEPDYLPAYISRAECYEKKGDPARAITEYDHLVELAPKTGLVERGNYYGDHGDPVRALADFQKALDLDPQDASAYNARAWMLASGPTGRNGRAALADATKACDLSQWSDCNSLDTLAAAYAELGDFDHALKWQTKAVAAMPFDASTEDAAELKRHLALYRQHRPFHREK